MVEYQFTAKIISGHRLTVRNDIVDELGLVEGDKVRVTIQRASKVMRENTVVTEGFR